MLGFMLTDSAVGYYSAANKIKGLVVGLITAILATLLPRSSYYLGQNKSDEYQKIVSKALNFSLFFSLPSAIGIMLLARPLILLFSGEEFLAALPAMLIMSPVIVFIAVASFADNMVLIPQRMEKVSLQSQIIGCVMNVTLNSLLIPIWGVFGAAFSTFVVEGIITVYKIFFSFKHIKHNGFLNNFIKVCVSCIFMAVAVFAILYFIKNVFLQILLGIISGATIYAATTLVLRTDTALMLAETIKKRIIKVKKC